MILVEKAMSEGETKFNPNNPNNFNVEAQLLLIPGFLIVVFVGKYADEYVRIIIIFLQERFLYVA